MYQYYFSEQFLSGLQSKSKDFQNKFYEIVDGICEYLDTEEEKQGFQKYIEENHSYNKPGNMLYSSKLIICGEQTEAKELKKKIDFHLLSLFDACESADVMEEVPHIIVCISAPDDWFDDKDMKFIENLISLERLCRGYPPVSVTTILNDTLNDRGVSCYVAGLK